MISSGKAHQILQEIADDCYIALHFDSPLVAGAYASEVSGTGYARVKIDFSEPSSRSIYNLESIMLRGLPQTRVTWLGGWDARENGNILWHVELDDPVVVQPGGGFGINAGDITISF